MNEIIVERPNLFEPNVYISVCVEMSGKFSTNNLIAAIKSAYEANEATMSKIVLKQDCCYYEKLSVTGCKIEIIKDDWLEVVKRKEKEVFSIDKGELVRTFIIPLKDKAQILIMAHHLVGDGKSVIYFVKDIMNALSGKPLTYKPLTLATKESLPRKGLSLSAKFFSRYCKYKWKTRTFSWQDYYDLHDSYWQNNTSDICYEILSAEKTQTIIEQSKQIGCSVNSFLVTEFLRKFQKRCEIGIPVSIRQNQNESMSNLVSGIKINHKYNDKKSFPENALRVHRKINQVLCKKKFFVLLFLSEFPATLIDAVLLNKYKLYSNSLAQKTAEIMGYSETKVRDLGISNLGILDIPALYEFCKIENIIFVPPAVSYSHNVIGVSTINGRMTISYHGMACSAKKDLEQNL